MVSDYFSRVTEPRTSRQEAIVRVALQLLRGDARGLAIRGGGNDELEKFLYVPAAFDEVNRQPVEQLWMRRRFAADAPVFRRLDEAQAEDLPPVAINRHASSQWVLRAHHPFSEIQAVRRGGSTGRSARSNRRENSRHTRFHFISLVE